MNCDTFPDLLRGSIITPHKSSHSAVCTTPIHTLLFTLEAGKWCAMTNFDCAPNCYEGLQTHIIWATSLKKHIKNRNFKFVCFHLWLVRTSASHSLIMSRKENEARDPKGKGGEGPKTGTKQVSRSTVPPVTSLDLSISFSHHVRQRKRTRQGSQEGHQAKCRAPPEQELQSKLPELHWRKACSQAV